MTVSDAHFNRKIALTSDILLFHTPPPVHELAVDSDYRGQGIAKICLAVALDHHLETDVVLGIYDQAKDARLMYDRWGFEDLGPHMSKSEP